MRVTNQHALHLYEPGRERFVDTIRELEDGKSYYILYQEKDTFTRLQKLGLAM